jgi:hypothetical protein
MLSLKFLKQARIANGNPLYFLWNFWEIANHCRSSNLPATALEVKPRFMHNLLFMLFYFT